MQNRTCRMPDDERSGASSFLIRHSAFLLCLTALLLISGCFAKPNQANIELRKQNQQLQAQVSELQQTLANDRDVIRSLASTRPTTQQLSQDRLDQLFTVAGLKFGRLTGPEKAALKLYLFPVDAHGDLLKAAGSFTVELFDLSPGVQQPRIGSWDFSLEESRKQWYGQGLLNEYVLTCPWQTRPQHGDLLVKVTFTDALTGRVFSAERPLKLKLPLE